MLEAQHLSCRKEGGQRAWGSQNRSLFNNNSPTFPITEFIAEDPYHPGLVEKQVYRIIAGGGAGHDAC